jgi:hypothetical protein
MPRFRIFLALLAVLALGAADYPGSGTYGTPRCKGCCDVPHSNGLGGMECNNCRNSGHVKGCKHQNAPKH